MSERNDSECFVCTVCGKRYRLRHYFEKHKLTHETLPGSVIGGESTTSTEADGKVGVYFECKACSKQFKTKRGLNNHELTHSKSGANSSGDADVVTPESIQPTVDDDQYWPEEAVLLNAAQNVEEVLTFYEQEDEEQERLLLAAAMGVEAEPAQPIPRQAKKAPLVKCKFCGTGFYSVDGYVKHKMGHATNDAVTRAPPLDKVIEASAKITQEIAQLIFTENLNAETVLEKQLQDNACLMKEHIGSAPLNVFLKSVCELLYEVFQSGTKFLTPSHVRQGFLKGLSVLIANHEAKVKLKMLLVAALEIQDENVDINFFMISFIRKFAQKVLAYIIHWIVHDEEGPIRQSEYAETNQSLDSEEFMQLMHYIGGANVKSVLRCAWRSWGNNDECKLVIKVLRGNFLVSSADDMDAPDSKFMEWTLAQDRGKLLKVSNKALQLFAVLARIVKPLEHYDGSLILDEVLDKVLEHPKLLQIWEELTQEQLPAKVSFKLLHALCEYFCNTWRTGIVRRRLDQLQSSKSGEPQGTRGVAFRPKVVKFTSKPSA